MAIGEFCNREVVYIDQQASIAEAARLMRHHHVGDLVVTASRDGRVVPTAMLTDRDIVIELLAEGVEPEAVVVKDIMSQQLVTAGEQEDVYEVVQKMCVKGIRRLPVVNSEDELIGIFTVDDCLGLLAEQLNNVVQLISREQANERERRGPLA